MEEMSAEARALSALFGLTVGVAMNRKMNTFCQKRGYRKMSIYLQVALPLSMVWNGYCLVKAVQDMVEDN